MPPDEKKTEAASPRPPMGKVLLLDMDGVLAEVSKSYRACIIETCRHHGATSITLDTVSEWKARGGCNNDWALSLDLINLDPNGEKGLTLAQVTETFESFYQGTEDRAGLCDLETLICKKEVLEELRRRATDGMAVVTGRPRKDCNKFLQAHGIDHLFDCCVCMEDGPPKPDPFPVARACELLGVKMSQEVIMVGDTPDDIRAALKANCRGVGVSTIDDAVAARTNGKPHDSSLLAEAMKKCGATIVLEPGFEALVDMFAPVQSN